MVCATNAHSIGGSVAGLTGSVVLQDDGGDNLIINSKFDLNGGEVKTKNTMNLSSDGKTMTQNIHVEDHIAGDIAEFDQKLVFDRTNAALAKP